MGFENEVVFFLGRMVWHSSVRKYDGQIVPSPKIGQCDGDEGRDCCDGGDEGCGDADVVFVDDALSQAAAAAAAGDAIVMAS